MKLLLPLSCSLFWAYSAVSLTEFTGAYCSLQSKNMQDCSPTLSFGKISVGCIQYWKMATYTFKFVYILFALAVFDKHHVCQKQIPRSEATCSVFSLRSLRKNKKGVCFAPAPQYERKMHCITNMITFSPVFLFEF